jgi:hypothetical protein
MGLACCTHGRNWCIYRKIYVGNFGIPFWKPRQKIDKGLMIWTACPELGFCEHDNEYSESINQITSGDIWCSYNTEDRSSGMWYSVGWYMHTNVWEKPTASIFRTPLKVQADFPEMSCLQTMQHQWHFNKFLHHLRHYHHSAKRKSYVVQWVNKLQPISEIISTPKHYPDQ